MAYNPRTRLVGVIFVILGILFGNQAIGYLRIHADTPAYIMLAASIMMILSGIFRIYRSGLK
jgi:hypothetical protein